MYAGRGSGKTELMRRYVVRWLPVKKPWNDPIYFFALPTYNQAKRVAWPKIKELVPKSWRPEFSESSLTVKTKFGSTLYVLGLDKPQRAEGVQWDGGVIDESSDQRPGVFDLSLMPAMTHRRAWCRRIGVPKRNGVGAAEFKKFCDLGASGKDPSYETYTWPSWDILSPDQLREARENLDPKDYAEQYGASWETVGGLVFYGFHEVLSLTEQDYNPSLPILVGSDFNVDPMAWVLAQGIGDNITVFDELWLRSANTQMTLDHLYKKYAEHKAGWIFFGDAAGRSRHTSASFSDYAQIKGDKRFEKSKVMYPLANPARADRFAACNRMFADANDPPRRRLKINRRCKNLINDLGIRAYKQGTNEPEDSHDVGHITDALGYIIHWLFPIKIPTTGASPTVVIR